KRSADAAGGRYTGRANGEDEAKRLVKMVPPLDIRCWFGRFRGAHLYRSSGRRQVRDLPSPDESANLPAGGSHAARQRRSEVTGLESRVGVAVLLRERPA